MIVEEWCIVILLGITGVVLLALLTAWICDRVGWHCYKKRNTPTRAQLDPDGFAPHDFIEVVGGEEQGRTAWVTEAGAFRYKGTVYVSVVFTDNKAGRTDFDEHGLIEKEYCWNVTRKGGYRTNGTDKGKLS